MWCPTISEEAESGEIQDIEVGLNTYPMCVELLYPSSLSYGLLD